MWGTEERRDDLTIEILKAMYLHKGERDWEDICKRVANAIATNEEEYLEFRDLMVKKIFLPSSPTLMNAGTKLGQLAACFVIPLEDSIEGIFDALKTAALIQKTGGGTGFDFSKIHHGVSTCPCNDYDACGFISLIKLFNEATNVIMHFGKRRGANMGVLNITHKDIIPFIRAKREEGELSNFNISVMVPDAFMKLVDSGKTHEIWNKKTGLTASNILNEIVEGIWKNGEPGVLFYDRINRDNYTPALGDISATNPCGEEPLLPYESCNLGSLNLSHFVTKGEINWDNLRVTTEKAVCFLDNVIDKNTYSTTEIETTTKKTRKLGLGVMGFHDMLLKLGLPYDSSETLEIAEKVMEQISRASVRESRKLAAEKGTFPEHLNSTWELPMRNAALTAIAPTGTISILAGCSSGIEPVFSWVYKRKRTTGKEFLLVHPLFESYFRPKLSDVDYNWLLEHVYLHGTLQNVEKPGIVNNEEMKLFRSALDIDWKAQINVQAAFQRHCHAGISKTINMPDYTEKEDIRKALIYAWKQELKGITIYRTGSRQRVVLNLKKG